MTLLAAIPGELITGTFSAINQGALQYIDIASALTSTNTLFGLSGFSIINNPYLNWNAILTPLKSISITSTNTF
jgi:hypothetical protein